jgi:hypothetical protein
MSREERRKKRGEELRRLGMESTSESEDMKKESEERQSTLYK